MAFFERRLVSTFVKKRWFSFQKVALVLNENDFRRVLKITTVDVANTPRRASPRVRHRRVHTHILHHDGRGVDHRMGIRRRGAPRGKAHGRLFSQHSEGFSLRCSREA